MPNLGDGVKAGLWTLDWTMDWTMDWNMDSHFHAFSHGSKPGLELGAVLGLGTTQESPQQQLVDLKGNLALSRALISST